MSDPDFSQHATAPGAPAALAALHSADEMLGIVLATLKEKSALEKTDIFIVSDHGFSTIYASADPVPMLTRAGLTARKSFTAPPEKGDVLVVNTGATSLLYVTGHDPATVEKVVRAFQAEPMSGVIFSREKIDGTFPLSAAKVDSPDAPDVLVAPRWTADKNPFGVPGMLLPDPAKKIGLGMHGSLSPFDQTNTLIAAGPDIRAGWRDELPSGNIDIAPTVLWLMGIRPLGKLDGRVLFEAIRDRKPEPAKPEEKRIEAACDVGGVRWTQYLRTVTYQGSTYLLEGNGAQAAK
jgi:arylsulfatase A-like enzyme